MKTISAAPEESCVSRSRTNCSVIHAKNNSQSHTSYCHSDTFGIIWLPCRFASLALGVTFVNRASSNAFRAPPALPRRQVTRIFRSKLPVLFAIRLDPPVHAGVSADKEFALQIGQSHPILGRKPVLLRKCNGTTHLRQRSRVKFAG
jgi:hypothetical protein